MLFRPLRALKEVQPTISFLTGRVFSEADARILKVGGTTVSKIEVYKTNIFGSKKLTILMANQYFNEISKLRGKGSRKKRRISLKASLAKQPP